MKRVFLINASWLLIIFLVACGTESLENSVSPGAENVHEENQTMEAADHNEDIHEEDLDAGADEFDEEPSQENDVQSKAMNEEEDDLLIEEKGIYVGRADPHTVEIRVDGNPIAYQILQNLREKVDQLTEGREVHFTYKVKGETKEIQAIEPLATDENDEESLQTENGIFVGQADPHTIEVEMKDDYVAFQLTMDARDDALLLREGEEVTFSYHEAPDVLTIHTIQSVTRKDHLRGKGIYIGQADPHTIEIQTEEGAFAFQLTMEARKDVEKLQSEDEVLYTYIEEGDFREIDLIQKVID